MKVYMRDAVYVQKNDLAFLLKSGVQFPLLIYMKAFEILSEKIDDNNRYDFIKFEGEDEISFFDSLDWIIDYDNVKDLDEDEIIRMGANIQGEQQKLLDTYNSLSDDEKSSSDLAIKANILSYKYYSLRDLYLFRKGVIKMTLPFYKSKSSFIKIMMQRFKKY